MIQAYSKIKCQILNLLRYILDFTCGFAICHFSFDIFYVYHSSNNYRYYLSPSRNLVSLPANKIGGIKEGKEKVTGEKSTF